VVVTEGVKGATAFCATGHVSMPAHSVAVRDTVAGLAASVRLDGNCGIESGKAPA
jgi:hypothetical protein